MNGLKPWSETIFGIVFLFLIFAAMLWLGEKIWPKRCPQMDMKGVSCVERSNPKAR